MNVGDCGYWLSGLENVNSAFQPLVVFQAGLMIIYLFELGLAVVRLGIRLFFLLVYYSSKKRSMH